MRKTGLRIVTILSSLLILFSFIYTPTTLAYELTEVDATSTISEIATSVSTTSITVDRVEQRDPVAYRYHPKFPGLAWTLDSQCIFLLGDIIIDERSCGWMLDSYPGLQLETSGVYTLKVDNVVVATFTFTEPTDKPLPLGKAVCVFKKVSYSKPTTKGTWITIVDNGKCTANMGELSMSYQTTSGFGGYSNVTLTKGRFLVKGLTPKSLQGKSVSGTFYLGFYPDDRLHPTTKRITINK